MEARLDPRGGADGCGILHAGLARAWKCGEDDWLAQCTGRISQQESLRARGPVRLSMLNSTAAAGALR